MPGSGQNTSHAVMAQRAEPRDSRDDFPSPPWATRALIEHVLKDKETLARSNCLEPACGAGSMAETLKEYFAETCASDAFDYGYGPVRDFLAEPYDDGSYDWVITNPPFRLAAAFVLRALELRGGESPSSNAPSSWKVSDAISCCFRQPADQGFTLRRTSTDSEGRLDKAAATATSYGWMVWKKEKPGKPELLWISACRKFLERPRD